MTTDHHLRQLLEMLDHPEAYSEQEIRDIINNDDNSEAYRLLVDAKRSSRSRHTAAPIDVDAAWNDFEQKHLSHTNTTSNWFKTAASIIGILFITGMAFAAIHLWSPFPASSPKSEESEYASISDTIKRSTPISPEKKTEGEAAPIVFDNIPLEKMLEQIAAYYNKEVEFQNDDVRQLRFYFVWKQDETLDVVLHRLNLFESVNAELKSDKIIVE